MPIVLNRHLSVLQMNYNFDIFMQHWLKITGMLHMHAAALTEWVLNNTRRRNEWMGGFFGMTVPVKVGALNYNAINIADGVCCWLTHVYIHTQCEIISLHIIMGLRITIMMQLLHSPANVIRDTLIIRCSWTSNGRVVWKYTRSTASPPPLRLLIANESASVIRSALKLQRIQQRLTERERRI